MMNAQFTYHKDKLTKWLLTVTVLFSIITFSGYAGNYQSKQQQATQTELVILFSSEFILLEEWMLKIFHCLVLLVSILTGYSFFTENF